MKVVSTILLLCLGAFSANSQGAFDNSTNTALQKVIGDYPNKFINIKGELLAENVQTVDFRSKVEIPGIPCVLTQYSASKKPFIAGGQSYWKKKNFQKQK